MLSNLKLKLREIVSIAIAIPTIIFSLIILATHFIPIAQEGSALMAMVSYMTFVSLISIVITIVLLIIAKRFDPLLLFLLIAITPVNILLFHTGILTHTFVSLFIIIYLWSICSLTCVCVLLPFHDKKRNSSSPGNTITIHEILATVIGPEPQTYIKWRHGKYLLLILEIILCIFIFTQSAYHGGCIALMLFSINALTLLFFSNTNYTLSKSMIKKLYTKYKGEVSNEILLEYIRYYMDQEAIPLDKYLKKFNKPGQEQ